MTKKKTTNLVQLIEQAIKDAYNYEVVRWENTDIDGWRVIVHKNGYYASFLVSEILQNVLTIELIEKGLVWANSFTRAPS